jgi:hypothetical protein
MGEEMHVYFQNSIPQHPTRIETRNQAHKSQNGSLVSVESTRDIVGTKQIR